MMKKAELVFIPSPGIGHLVSTIEFARVLLERSDQFSITVLLIRPPNDLTKDAYKSLTSSASHTHIRFIDLPQVQPPPIEFFTKSVDNYVSVYIESHKACVKEAILEQILPTSPKVAGLVLDLFCTSMIDVGHELGVPSYMLLTYSAAFLGFLLYLPNRHDRVGREFEELGPEENIKGYKNPVPANVLPSVAFNKAGGYICFVNHARRFKETKGVIVNTFLEMEFNAISSLFSYDLPPIYTVGPLINHKKNPNHLQSNHQAQHDEIMKWLDDQPQSSVVFLCFGSWGSFGVRQLRETALGLEKSGYRFLWSMKISGSSESADQNEVLPEGFLERTKDKGFICGWAPQVEVLAHKAVGAFVSHCGWNSILESLWYGVPIATWPLYAEQQLNAFQMAKDLGLAVEFRMDYRFGDDSIVKAEEISQAVKSVMKPDSEVRKRVKNVSMQGRKAISSGGSSFDSVGLLLDAFSGRNQTTKF